MSRDPPTRAGGPAQDEGILSEMMSVSCPRYRCLRKTDLILSALRSGAVEESSPRLCRRRELGDVECSRCHRKGVAVVIVSGTDLRSDTDGGLRAIFLSPARELPMRGRSAVRDWARVHLFRTGTAVLTLVL